MTDSSNSGNARRTPRFAALSPLRQVSGEAAAPPAQHRAFRRLHTHQQFLPLLVVTTVLTLLVILVAGYAAARANALSAAEASARTNARIAREVISERGQFPAIANHRLVATSGTNSSYPLVNDTWVVDHVRQLTGDQAVIYQLADAKNPSLRSVASNLPKTDSQGHAIANTRATGQSMPSEAQAAIFGSCGGHVDGGMACYASYSGTVTIGSTSYVAAFTPLLDQSGVLVGAVGVLTPLDEVLAAPKQLAIMLLSMGLLVGLIVLVVGTWVAGRFPNRLLQQLDSQLDTMAHAATELGRLAHQQQTRLQRQQRTARQVGQCAVRLESLTSTMENGQSDLRKTTTAIWEEVSQPGIAIDLQTALRLAREAAVRASAVGMASDETRQHARQVITLMNRVLAEGRALAQEGLQAESHARALAETLDHMETDLGEQLVPRRYDLGSTPLIRHMGGVSQRLRQLLKLDEQSTIVLPRPASNNPSARPGKRMTDAPGSLPGGLPLQDTEGRSPSVSSRSNEPMSGIPGRGEHGFQSPADPHVSGSRHGGWRSAGDSSLSPGWLSPGFPNQDDLPPRGPNDSYWLND